MVVNGRNEDAIDPPSATPRCLMAYQLLGNLQSPRRYGLRETVQVVLVVDDAFIVDAQLVRSVYRVQPVNGDVGRAIFDFHDL